MKRIVLLILPTLVVATSFAQSTNVRTLLHKNNYKADYLYDRFGYRNALEIYLRQFEHNPKDVHIRERIASCYLKLRDPVSSELWYKPLVTEPGVPSRILFDYAEVLSMNGKYDDSRQWFAEYLKLKPDDKVAGSKLEFLKNIGKYTNDDGRFTLSTFDLNTRYSEFGASVFRNGIVFVSSRETNQFIKRKPFDGLSQDESFFNLYYAEKDEIGDWYKFTPFYTSGSRTNYHEGPLVFYDRSRSAAFTRSNAVNGKALYDQSGKVNLEICFASLSENGSLVDVVPFKFNSDRYSNAHPSFSRDGSTMYFASTMPSGFGGSDVYYSTFSEGQWSEPVNVGDAVNTAGNESFPYIANDTTLYFSSNGHGSLGGLDIYVSYKRQGKFTIPVNPGAPLNTRFDDFSFVCDSLGRSGFLASNEAGGKGQDDIYHFTLTSYLLPGVVHERNGRPIAQAKVSVSDSNGTLIASATTGDDGSFRFVLPFDKDYVIKSEKSGFEAVGSLSCSTHGKPLASETFELLLEKRNLISRGRIFSNETQSVLPGVTVVLRNVTDAAMDSVVVNEDGEYHFLVSPDKKYLVEASKAGYILNGFALDTKGIAEGELLNDIVLEQIYVDKQVILFDYDRASLTKESATLLDRIVGALKEHPHTTLNVGTHSDARGTSEYNIKLSQKRSEAVRNYLVRSGISESRIQSKWFGEQLVINKCSDGVICPEEEHSRNRRAELKVQRELIK
jgi:outer membrane protein OmpA-like peptidoglycan-associated protein